MSFRDWVIQLEVFAGDSIQQHQPKDGKWYPPLNPNSGDYGTYKYYFNVEGDDCGTPESPCYAVSIYDGPYGASISFNRNDSHDDSGKGVASKVFMSVLKALSEFIDTKNPFALRWSAISKTKVNPITGYYTNPEARKHIYEKWAIRNLFPDRYVPIDSSNWIRRDAYDDTYVAQQGYPPVPQDVTADSSPAQKKIAYNKLAEERKNNEEKKERIRQEEEARLRRAEEERQAEERRQREEQLRSYLQNPEVNPHNLKLGDIVDLSGVSTHRGYQNRAGKIHDFHLNYNQEMLANVAVFYEGDESSVQTYEYFKLSQLQPETEETKAARQERIRQEEERARQEEERLTREREERLQAAINDPVKNPDGLKPGDNVVSYMGDNITSDQNGLVGVLNRFVVSGFGNVLLAYVDWDDHAIEVLGSFRHDRPVRAEFLRKNTPDVAERIAAERRRREQEEVIARQREREEEERQEQETLQRNAAETTALANDTENNPQGFKVGDHVVITGGWPYRNHGKRGIIINLYRASWGNAIKAIVKLSNSRTYPIDMFIRDLARDESEETQRRQQRRQQRAQRTATIQQATQAGGFQIGDIVNVTSGLNRNKTGRIVQFQSGTQGNVRAVMMDVQNNNRFTANIRALQRVETEPVAQAS